MSYDNHDQQDPNRVRYAKSESKQAELTNEDLLNGRAIKIYAMASTMPLKEFMKWFKESYPTI